MQNNPSILIVEDLDADAILVNRQIQDIWPEAQIVKVDCLETANDEIDQTLFDLIVLDLNLPNSSGADTVQKMRSISDDIPLVVVTGLEIDFIVNA